MDELGQELHDARVGVAVVERAGLHGALENGAECGALQESRRTPLQEAGEQAEQIIHLQNICRTNNRCG